MFLCTYVCAHRSTCITIRSASSNFCVPREAPARFTPPFARSRRATREKLSSGAKNIFCPRSAHP